MSAFFRFGDAKLRRYTPPASTAISVGDMLFKLASDGKTYPASSFTWNSTLALTQHDFHNVFSGVSNQRRRADQTDAPVEGCVQATGGVWQFDCAALGATLQEGSFVGPAKASGNTLENQKVVSVARDDLSIGRTARVGLAGVTTLLVEIVSSIFAGGAQNIQAS